MADTRHGGVVERTYLLTGYSGEERSAHLRIRCFRSGERIRRGVGALALWWVVALGCVFIPVAHFALVPGFLVYGVLSFARRFRTTAVVVAASGTCPDCGAEQDLDLLGPWRDGRELACRRCHRSLRLAAR